MIEFGSRNWGFGSNFVQYAVYIVDCKNKDQNPVVNYYLNPVSENFNIFKVFEVSKNVHFISKKCFYFYSVSNSLRELKEGNINLLELFQYHTRINFRPFSFLYSTNIQKLFVTSKLQRGLLKLEQRYEERLLSNKSLLKTSFSLGIHIRGGDKNQERKENGSDTLGYEVIVSRIEEISNSNNITSIFIAGDDNELLIKLKKYFSNTLSDYQIYVSPYFIHEGHDQSTFNKNTIEYKKIEYDNFLTDVTLLSRCNHFLGDTNSNIFYLVGLIDAKTELHPIMLKESYL